MRICGKKFLRRRLCYQANSTASFNPCILTLELSGDIHPQPGPNTIIGQCSRNSQRKLSFLLINAHSLNSKLQDFQSMVYSKDCDVIVVCETWLTSVVLDGEILPYVYIYRRDRYGDRRGVGVLIATKNDIESTRRRDLESNCEIVICEINPSEGRKINLCAFYRSPSSTFEYLMRT